MNAQNIVRVLTQWMSADVAGVSISYLNFADACAINDMALANNRQNTAPDDIKCEGIYAALRHGHIQIALHFNLQFQLPLNENVITDAYHVSQNSDIIRYAISGWIPINIANCLRHAIMIADYKSMRMIAQSELIDRRLEGWTEHLSPDNNTDHYYTLECAVLVGFKLKNFHMYLLMRWAIGSDRIKTVQYLFMIGWKKIAMSDMYTAIHAGYTDMVRLIIEEMPGFRMEGASLVRSACIAGREPVLRYLLSAGLRSQYARSDCTARGHHHLIPVIDEY